MTFYEITIKSTKYKRHKKSLIMKDIRKIFLKPSTPLQRQYEAIRAMVIDDVPASVVANKYGYSVGSLYSRIRDLRTGKLKFFVDLKRGPKKRRTPEHIRRLALEYRKENLSSRDIKIRLEQEGYNCSIRTIDRILTDAHIPKLHRRPLSGRAKTTKNQTISERSQPLDFDVLKPFRYDCPVAGIFFFLPHLIESGIIDIVKQCALPESSAINSEQSCLSMLLLKLIGNERLSHISNYDHEPGFGVFAGLNLLPKKSFMGAYSCRTSEALLQNFQQQLMGHFQKKYPDFYQSSFINLDFHSIPHFGDQSQMEKVWCGARGKAMKGANTIFAQDANSNVILYTRADILRKNEAKEVRHFAAYWKTVKGSVNETLVFDCKLTTYKILDELHCDSVKFITLRKRNAVLLTETSRIADEEWQRIYLPIPKRMHKACSAHENTVVFDGCKTKLRQIIIKSHGRAEPTFIITNNYELPLKDVLIVYAKRWHIENKLAELVSFFNLNALSSPLMIRIHFDILWTVIADTLYHRFAQDLPRFERERADSLFRRFINMPGQVIYDGKEFVIKIRKRAHTPILLGVKCLQQSIKIPWLGDRSLRIEWTA